jgi:EmrB/QacA subfamily drug resistance transporter
MSGTTLHGQPARAVGPGGHAPRKGLALTLIAVAQMMVVLDVSVVNVALPSIQNSLHFSTADLEWVVNAYAIAFGGLLLLGGRVADVWGQRRTFLAGAALLTTASLLGGLATDQAWLLTARAVQGASGALLAPAALALLTSTFEEGAERNKAMGVYGAVSGVGGALGNILGGVFTDTLSWRWVLFINVPIGLFTLLAAPTAFREYRSGAAGLDLPGAATVTAGMSLGVYGLTHATSHPWGSAGTLLPLIVGGLLLVSFVLIEARTHAPLMPLRLLADRARSGAYLVMLVLGAALIAMFYFLTLYLQVVLRFSPMRTGFAFLAFACGAVVAASIGGQLVGRAGPRPLLLVGTAVSAGALFWMARLTAGSSYFGGLFGPLLVAGLGMGLCFVPLALAAVAGVRPAEAGVGSALLNTAQQVGGALGLAVLGTVAASATRNRVAAHHIVAAPGPGLFGALTHGYDVAFLVAGAALLAAFVVTLVMVRVPAEEAARAAAAGVAV